jgi:SAM-dependent methyltransferase
MKDANWTLKDKEIETVPCPLCGGDKFLTLVVADRYDMGITTQGCTNCGLLLTNPQPNEHTLNDFYKNHYRKYYQKTDKPNQEYIKAYRKDERAVKTANFLFENGDLPKGAKILDIGASEGCILKALGDINDTIESTAVEPNPEFRDFAKTYANCTTYADINEIPDGKLFDLIILNHVFEHLKQPLEYLKSLSKLLTTHGKIYIDLPDADEYEDLTCLHIAHLYHFTGRTLSLVAEKSGYEVLILEKHQPIMHPRSLRCIIKPGSGSKHESSSIHELEAWGKLSRLKFQALRYHRKRWSVFKKIKYLFNTLSLPRTSDLGKHIDRKINNHV